MFWRLVNKYFQVVKNRKNRNTNSKDRSLKHGNETLDVTTTDEVRNSSDESDNTLLDIVTNARIIINSILTPVLSHIQHFKV